MNTAIFYASSTGNTSSAANLIAEQLNNVPVYDIADVSVEKIKEFDNVIIGTSTWGEGDLQDDFEESWDEFCNIDFTGKRVALFGLGDQEGYADNFLDAMGTLYEKVVQNGAEVVGESVIDDDFDFEESKAVKDGKFVGLALDEDNQSEYTQRRIDIWCSEIKEFFN